MSNQISIAQARSLLLESPEHVGPNEKINESSGKANVFFSHTDKAASSSVTDIVSIMEARMLLTEF